jgi:N-acetylneuraminic acid mutarotase
MRLVAGAVTLALCTGGCGESASSAAERWRALRDSTLARTEVAAARIGDGAYVVGGFAAPGVTSDVVERYDLRRDRWTRVAPIPQAVNHAAAVAYRGALYVAGGYTAAGGLAAETAALWRYDPAADRWTRLADAPTARGALVAGVVGDRLYVAGGARAGKALKTLEVYDFASRRWSTGPPMGVAREHLAGAALGGAFYALAGRTAQRGNLKVVERYVPARGRWERVASMRKRRGGIAAAAVHGRIVVVGGEEAAGTIGEVESFEPRLRRWRREPRLPTPRHGLGAVSFGGRVFVLEGGPQPGLAYSDAVEALRIAR